MGSSVDCIQAWKESVSSRILPKVKCKEKKKKNVKDKIE